MTIADKLTQLNIIKQDIKTAINNKGGSVANDFTIYANAITSLPSDGGGDVEYGSPVTITVKFGLATVKTITAGSFDGWATPTGLVIEEGYDTIADKAFNRWTNVESISLPASLRTIGTDSFYNAAKCKALTFKNGLTSIGTRAFYSCGVLNINLPDSLKTIATDAFAFCNKCTELTIGFGVTNIAGSAFASMAALKTINSKPTTPPAILSNTFSGLPVYCVIKVPSASLDTYKTAQHWSVHASKMVGI